MDPSDNHQTGFLFPMRSIFFFISVLFTSAAVAQSYFQQEVNYRIQVTLDDVKHGLSASEIIEYTNNSPDTLREIYFHLWPNAYKNNSTALAMQQLEDGKTQLYYAKPEDRGFIDSLDFMVNNEKVRWDYDSVHIDICKLVLNKPLVPGTKIFIYTPFHVKIPSARFSRLGHIGQSYMITQWYPKPAVYDRNGWHPMPYLDQGEFYSEFGSFNVIINVPRNYVVAATGDLQNPEEMNWLDQKVVETKTMKDFGNDVSFPKSDREFKHLTFKENNVHDFAWFADKRFHVLKGSVELPHTHSKITTWAMFTNKEAELWRNSIEYMNHALYDYSLWNGDYAYRNCTAIDGTIAAGGGMEYPTITVIGNSGNKFTLEDALVHELGHNWFYGMLGSNERDHAWMDEGINSFNELRYVYTKYPNSYKEVNDITGLGAIGKICGTDKMTFKDGFYLYYQIANQIHTDQPVDITSADFTPFNYGAVIYVKTALLMDYLKSYLGDSLFDACMQRYFSTWKFKHPYPEDVRNIFESTSGKKLGWFFDGLLKTPGKIDYAITGVKSFAGENFVNTTGRTYALTLKNRGDVSSPLSVSAMKKGEVISTRWLDGFTKKDTILFTCKQCDAFRIDAQKDIPEVNRQIILSGPVEFSEKWNPRHFSSSENSKRRKNTDLFSSCFWLE